MARSAVGLSGEDGALFSAMQRKPIINGSPTDIGLVGDVVSVDASAVEDLSMPDAFLLFPRWLQMRMMLPKC